PQSREKTLTPIRPRFLIGSRIMIDDIRRKHLVQHSKVSARSRLGKFCESREIFFLLSHPHSPKSLRVSKIPSSYQRLSGSHRAEPDWRKATWSRLRLC